MDSGDGKKGGVASPVSVPPVMPAPIVEQGIPNPSGYSMNFSNRGSAVIINNKLFKLQGGRTRTREGTDVDRLEMYATLDTLGFENITVRQNLKKADMKKHMEEVAKEDHTDSSCFVGVILTYGKNGYVMGTDGLQISIEDLIEPFKGRNCPSLLGKPKIFFVQACSDAEAMQTDFGERQTYGGDQRLPEEADIYLAVCNTPGSLAWNGTNPLVGSWFIQATTQGLNKFWKEKDLNSIMTAVLRKIDKDYQTKTGRTDSMNHVYIEARTTQRIFFLKE